ncbi:MAG TPA: helix-hairpin-helix domain-containing protein [bacterium]|nr:helix-hairpin-helix domain-containing protein [bacterium]
MTRHRLLLLSLGVAWLAMAAVALAADAPRATLVDLNSATLEEMYDLPISPDMARAIFNYREYRGYFKSIYDLMMIPGMDSAILEQLKPLVSIEPVEADQLARDISDAQRNIRSWGSSEDTNEGLIDLWIDIAKDRPNINTAGVYDLMNLQNISPVDAVAIFNHRKAIDSYRSRTDLRYTPNLSGWGYMNARGLVKYVDTDKQGDLHGRYQLRTRSSIFDTNVADDFKEDLLPATGIYDSWYDRLGLAKTRPELSQKLFLKYYLGQQTTLHGGLQAWRVGGEPDVTQHIKGFAGIEDVKLGSVSLDRLYVGDYLVSFGQGLVMENNDSFKSRKSGYSFDTRYYGILGDMSRTEEYKLRGVAAEASWRNLKGIGFYSDDRKDAVLNKDGSVASYIVLSPEISNATLTKYGLPPMHDALHEHTLGGNLRYVLWPGTHIGISGYQSTYNRRFDPMGGETLIDRFDKVTKPDNEIFNSYKSPGKFRRVYGLEMMSVYKSYCLQSEYAEMGLDGKLLKLGDDPHAFVTSLWSQFNNLNLLALYRDYSLGFDNPYNRGFANYSRFKGTILEDQYYLTDPLYGLVFDRSETPQAERGLYLSSRYRISESLIPRFEYDRWTRVSDGSTYSRFVANLEWRLVYPLRLKLRQQYQGRNQDNSLVPTSYDLNETRIELDMRLSAYDMVEFMYLFGGTKWPPRPRLTGDVDPDGDYPAVGQAYEPARALLLRAIHNFNDAFNVSAGAICYNGFVWYFEESDFEALSRKNSVRFWFSAQDRLSDQLWLEAKAAFDRALPITNLDIRRYNQPYGSTIDANDIANKDKYFRIQLDYMW